MGLLTNSGWIYEWLSEPRWSRYLHACNGDPERALELYEANTRVAGAVMHDIAHIEVAIRNAFDRMLTASCEGEEHWLFNKRSPVRIPLLGKRNGEDQDLNERNRQKISEAKGRLKGKTVHPGQVVAELSFGFWTHLTDSGHEKSLWVPYLHKAFPKSTGRKQIWNALKRINDVRNRASHHEPLFTQRRKRDVLSAQQELLELADLLEPRLAEHIKKTSSVAKCLKAMDAVIRH